MYTMHIMRMSYKFSKKKVKKNLTLFQLISKKIFQAQLKFVMKFSDYKTKNQSYKHSR